LCGHADDKLNHEEEGKDIVPNVEGDLVSLMPHGFRLTTKMPLQGEKSGNSSTKNSGI
jgi:hypothetical protein